MPTAARALLPHADRALEWIAEYRDAGGTGSSSMNGAPGGLFSRSWKDSFDGINFAVGRLPQAPIALAEVQGYVYGALRAPARQAFGDPSWRAV